MAHSRDFTDTFSDIFVKALDTLAANQGGGGGATFIPIAPTTVNTGFGAVDVLEGENNIKLFFDVPGTNKTDVKLELTRGAGKVYILNLSATRKPVLQNRNGLKNERFQGTKNREIFLPSDIDPASITARQEDGVLMVTVSKIKQETCVKSIPIS